MGWGGPPAGCPGSGRNRLSVGVLSMCVCPPRLPVLYDSRARGAQLHSPWVAEIASCVPSPPPMASAVECCHLVGATAHCRCSPMSFVGSQHLLGAG